MHEMERWLREREITEVECLVADLNGIARGKILPAAKFIRSLNEDTLRLPEAVFVQTVTGDYAAEDRVTDPALRDVRMRPDPRSLRVVPWYQEATAQVISDCYHHDGAEVAIAPRQVLQRVLRAYEDRGWRPVVAPELEFFLTKINEDPDYPLEPPIGRSRRPESARQSYGIEAVNEFDPIFEDVYAWCEAQEIDIDTLTHESGAAQMEINFNHGEPLELADQAFLFKRTLRQAASSSTASTRPSWPSRWSASPAAPCTSTRAWSRSRPAPTCSRPARTASPSGSSSTSRGCRSICRRRCRCSPRTSISYRRLRRYSDAPINLHWGWENRTVGLRVPDLAGAARRVENRVAGADANLYLAIAASFACGLLGMVDERRRPSRSKAAPIAWPRPCPPSFGCARPAAPRQAAAADPRAKSSSRR